MMSKQIRMCCITVRAQQNAYGGVVHCCLASRKDLYCWPYLRGWTTRHQWRMFVLFLFTYIWLHLLPRLSWSNSAFQSTLNSSIVSYTAQLTRWGRGLLSLNSTIINCYTPIEFGHQTIRPISYHNTHSFDYNNHSKLTASTN